MESLSLYELNNLVRGVLSHSMPQPYWVRAEVSSLSDARGHCFLELVEKGDDGRLLIAKAHAQVWARKWTFLQAYFTQQTGQVLKVGMKVMLQVEVTFHELYGYSLNVVDIEPSYTLGDMARHRQEIMRRLEQEGVADMNRQLPLPRLLRRVAVISSENAAGYGDFYHQLTNNRDGLAFDIRLFPAVMQGDGVEHSVITALNDIAANLDGWDVVVIIRGGGAVSDLSGFDSLALAENVAQYPLPIIVGIGHERDETVLDWIAHTRVKTPTAAAEFLIHHQKAEKEAVEQMALSLFEQVRRRMLDERNHLDTLVRELPLRFSVACQQRSMKETKCLNNLTQLCRQILSSATNKLSLLDQRAALSAKQLLLRQQHNLQMMAQQVDSADPKRLLQLGYSITRRNGHVVKDKSEIQAGDVLTTELAQGMVESVVRQ